MRKIRVHVGLGFIGMFLVGLFASNCGSEVEGGGNTTSGSTSSSSSGDSNFGACTGPGQCILAANVCCGLCTTPTLNDLMPINLSRASDYSESICGSPPPPCPACFAQPNPNLFAYCNAGSCAEADVTNHSLSACTTAADCRLRLGLECCEGCGGDTGGVVAIATNASQMLAQLACDGQSACPKCAPQYPVGTVADCVAGHCRVVTSMP